MGALVITSCSKDEDDDDNNNNQNPTPTTPDDSAPYPSFTDGAGTLVAIETISTSPSPIGPIETALGTAVAVFYNNPGDTAFLDAGEVKVEDEGLSKQSNNAYVFIPGIANATGVQYDGTVDWEVAGGASVTGFTQSVNGSFPSVEQISSGDTVSKADGYMLMCPDVNGADSVIFQVGEVIRTVAGNPSSYNFTPGDLAPVTAGTSIVQIAAYYVQSEMINGETYYFVNETTVSKFVTVE